jgi:hypothetical protein
MKYLVSFSVDLFYDLYIRISYIEISLLKFYAQNINNIFCSSFYQFLTLFFTSSLFFFKV